MRLAFMGTPDFAAVTLDALIAAGHEIAAVYSQPPRPAGRGQKLQPSPVESLARRHGLEVRTPKSLRDPAEQAAFAVLDLEAAVVAAYGLILPQAILDAPRRGCFNVHASLLPRWRGAAPIHRAILAGDAESGVTIMRMEAGLDTGPMLLTGRLPIGPRMTGGELHDGLASLGAGLMVEALSRLDTLRQEPQDDSLATYAAKIDKAEQRLDWSLPADQLDRAIRAFAPRPGAYAEIGGERIKILAASPVPDQGIPGLVLDSLPTVACSDGALRLERLQRAGKAPVEAADFQRGQPLAPGDRFDP